MRSDARAAKVRITREIEDQPLSVADDCELNPLPIACPAGLSRRSFSESGSPASAERSRSSSFAKGRMKPQGCKRHRWVKPRGREERERVSQSAVADNTQQTTTCDAVLSRRSFSEGGPVRHSFSEGGSLVRRRINSCPESYLNVSPPERNFVKRHLRERSQSSVVRGLVVPLRQSYSFTTSICLSSTWPVKRSMATCTQ
jgi:hypothetical protein